MDDDPFVGIDYFIAAIHGGADQKFPCETPAEAKFVAICGDTLKGYRLMTSGGVQGRNEMLLDHMEWKDLVKTVYALMDCDAVIQTGRERGFDMSNTFKNVFMPQNTRN